MNWNWFLSATVRQASQMNKHVAKLVAAQRDILSPEAVGKVEASMDSMDAAMRPGVPKKDLLAKMTELENTANKWLKPYPNASMRENIEVLLVAIAVAMAIRTFFVQPFKIPTGSMQPTLFGITEEDFIEEKDVAFPNPVSRFLSYWWTGVSYIHVRAETAGKFTAIDPKPMRFLLFNIRQRFAVGAKTYTVWFPPEEMFKRAGLEDQRGDPTSRAMNKIYAAGEDVIKLKVYAGDHLFVDRLTYNFRRPTRGEIIVFETRGIMGLPQDQFYIKRLVALGDEKVSVGNDRHVRINGQRLDKDTPHFEKIYSFDPNQPPERDHYSGHVNSFTWRNISQLFPNESTEYQVRPNHYMVMGDNTVNSYDSRAWGDFPRENVIGKSFVVYWPIGHQGDRPSRFGWSNR